MIRKLIIISLLLLSAATCVIWVLGWTLQGEAARLLSDVEERHVAGFTCDLYKWRGRTVGFDSSEGVFTVILAERIADEESPSESFRALGRFEWQRFVYNWHGTGRRLAVTIKMPIWALTAALMTYPTLAFLRGPLRRRLRRRRGRCIKCGYDLTGNRSGRCSECGATFDGTLTVRSDGEAA